MYSYLTENLPGIGGVIKEEAEDFLVTEIPLYLPSGEGEHVYVEIEKRGITTLEAIRRISRALGVAERDIGYAGLKDARALTRQTVSIPRINPDQACSLELPGIRVLAAVRHRNKLKPGHLAGNRFSLRVRDVGEDALAKAEQVITFLQAKGVPNFFGIQRYGTQGNSHLIGGALLAGDAKGAINALIGDSDKVDDERWSAAITAYWQGNLEESLRLFPPHCRTERDILQRLVKQPGSPEKALRALHPRLKNLYLSAWQSALFDKVLATRLTDINRLLPGDLAWKHDNGACFLVTDAEVEAERAVRFEVSPTGPLFGKRMTLPQGEPLAIEEEALRAVGLTLDSLQNDVSGGLAGERRPLRVPLGDARLKHDDTGLLLEFSLPKGSYATAVLREVMKN